MNWIKKIITIGKHAGKKPTDQEKSKSLFRIYDKCEICPLSVYIDVVCNDNLQALVIYGKPDKEDLLAAKSALNFEFAELSGNSEISSIVNIVRQMYQIQSQMLGFDIAIKLVSAGKVDETEDWLKLHIPNYSKPNDEESISKLIKKMVGLYKAKEIQLNELKKRYDAISSKGGDKIKPEYYTELLITISKNIGFHLKREELTLSEFAIYLKDLNRSIESLKSRSNGSK